jgi:MoxR-like ATPase
MNYPSVDEEIKILDNNMTLNKFEDFKLTPVLTPEKIIELQNDVKNVYLDPKIEKYIVRIVDATRNPNNYHLNLGKYIEFGASPRGSIGLYIAAKSNALITGKTYVTPFDVKTVAFNVLRHRVIMNYEGQAENIKTDDIVKEILDKVPVV